MRLKSIGVLFLAFPVLGCAEQTVRLIYPEVPADLRMPVERPTRSVSTLKDVTLILVEYDESLDEANSRIIAIDEILVKFEQKLGAQ